MEARPLVFIAIFTVTFFNDALLSLLGLWWAIYIIVTHNEARNITVGAVIIILFSEHNGINVER